MELKLEKKYLNFPVKSEAPKRRTKLIIDGKTAREFEIELADDEPDFWVFLDVSMFKGRNATIEVDELDKKSKALALICQDDTIKGSENLYQEKYRPQFHFSSRRGWNNDPNGLVYYKGEYHLFYQHNPYGWKWGNMHWGHAVSRDLVHWEELPIALYPHKFGDWCFSGSAVVDMNNTAGFKTGDEDVLVAAYTSTGRGESIAYSNDCGRTFTDYEGNPVVKHRGRDPKVIWYEPGNHWVMAVYDELDDSRGIAFYTSTDLKQWERESRIDGYYECPEIFELPVDGDKNNKKWVVYAADGGYAIGAFDGKVFTTESGKHRFNYGNCFYASQTFNNIPPQGLCPLNPKRTEDGRRIQIAWGQIGRPDMPFNQMMNFPVELTLRDTEEGIRMFAEPVNEIEKLRDKKHAWENKTLKEGENLLEGISGELFDIHAEFVLENASEFGFVIRGIPVTYNAREQQLTCKESQAPLKPQNGKIRLRILVDRTSIEIFGNDGGIYMPIGVIPPDENRSLEVFSKGGSVKVNSLNVYELHSAWK
jgi:fructan beta-fructosidase